jgi:cytochrome c peroxidase
LFANKLIVLSFIYTQCADAQGCPWASAILAQVRKRLASEPALADRVLFISLSFDPERDTPETLREYGARFGAAANWRFVVPAQAAGLAAMMRAYHQDFEPERDAAGRLTGGFAHLLRVFLIDGHQVIRNIYSAALLEPELLLNDLRSLAQEDGAAASVDPAGDTRGEARATKEARGSSPDRLAAVRQPPLGLPPVPVPAANPLTAAKVALGRKLFFDRRLSLNGTLSCAMCHIPDQGFTSNEMATAVGIEGRKVRRNTPTLFNVAYQTRLFHDGRENSLETQVWSPLLAANEMAVPSVGWVIERLNEWPDYRAEFERAFPGRGVSMDSVGQAFASYQRTLIAGDSAFDRWFYGKDPQALIATAQRGYALFTGKAGCGACHTIDAQHALFTDQEFHNTGIGWRNAMLNAPKTDNLPVAPGITLAVDSAAISQFGLERGNDLGRYEVTQEPQDRWRYKTPSLRNVALTAPYMHDGSLSSLDEVVAYYDRGAVPEAPIDARLRPLQLTDGEKSDLVAFLQSLTGGNVKQLVDDALAAPIGDPSVTAPAPP